MNWLVNKTRFVGSLLFLSTLIAVVLSACEPPSEVGITPANEIGIVFTDTITVKVSTVLTDSVRTNNGQFLMSGGFKDANFGTVSAVSFFEFSPRKLTFAANSLYDSTYLFLRFAYAFGDTSQTQEFFLHRTRDTLQTNKTYYSTNTFDYDPRPLGSIKFVPNQGRSVLVGKLPDELGRTVFAYKGDTTTAAAFRNFMKGYALVPSPRNTALFGFLPATSGTGVDIYSHITGTDTRRVLSLSMEPTPQSFSQTTSPPRFNNINADRRGTVLSNLRPLTPLSPKDLQGRLFVQDAIGIMTKVEFPHFANLYKNGQIAVNRAELSIRPVFLNATSAVIRPILTLVQSDANNRIARNSLGQVLFLPNDAATFSSFPGQQAAAFDPRFRTYTFQMGTYLQALVIGFKKNNGLLLSPSQPIDVGNGNFTYVLNQRFDQMVYDSKPETFKLVVFYTNVR